MPLSTNQDVSPYYDDFSELKDFYKVMFKPGVPVQARELNQFQSILQNQIEKFGDNIFQKGTIVDGCHLNFHTIFPYVKIKDSTTAGELVSVEEYEGYYLKNSANLQAYVVTSLPGFESQTPNLNTVYVRYLNSGNTKNLTAFSANQVLTVFKPDNRIFRVVINNGSTGFSNSDTVVVSSALAIQNSAGGTTFGTPFQVGEYINNGIGANVEVLTVDTTTNTDVVILNVRPQNIHLAGGNAVSWTISAEEGLTGLTSGATGTVVDLVGSGAEATVKTNSIGKITNVVMSAFGSGYYVTPDIRVRSATANTTQLAAANLASENFLAKVTVGPDASAPVGSGYGTTVTNGVIYQRGFFQRVAEQLVIVEAYANTPDAKVVGFTTEEEIINSNIDDSLLDNATGTPNHTAPGADRMKLTPTLVVMNKADVEGNTEFFTIAEFSRGAAFKHNKQTSYNIIGQELARRTAEESGNYVIDKFHLNTKSITPFANEAGQFVTTIDPGLAYINGYRVETLLNYNGAAAKATNTKITTASSISLNYGAYIKVNELAGSFDVAAGAVVSFYDTAKAILTTPAAIASAGTLIGKARIRSIVHESGTQGAPNAVYRMYLFDIVMNTGKTFASIKSVYSNATVVDGVADIVLVDTKAILYDSNESAVIFQSGVQALKNSNNISYTYRSLDETLNTTTGGLITKTLPAGESWQTTGVWSESDKLRLIATPHANVTATANIAGSVLTATTTANVTGTATTFTTILSPGDYIKFSNTTANGYGRVFSITNNTFLTLAANATVAITGANAQVYFPAGIPINLRPSTRTANVSGQTLTINLGQATNAANVSLVYNAVTANTQPVSKTVVRDVFVRLRLANNNALYTGPWCVGHADVFRMKAVYLGANNTFVAGDSGVTDVTNKFYIDHNQNEAVYDTSFLYKKGSANLTLSGTNTLLVKMDIFTTATEGLKTFQSYSLNDTTVLGSLTTAINTVELPELYGRTDNYYDLRDCMDFRPVSANTANAATSVVNATINPAEPVYATKISSSAKKFPAPGTPLTSTLEYYVGRVDRAIVDAKGNFSILTGDAGKLTPPTEPANAITINLINIPPYPSIPFSMSSDLVRLADTKIANEKFLYRRLQTFKISTPMDARLQQSEQPKGYKMTDIGKLEGRIADLEYYAAYLLSQMAALSREPTNTDGSTAINRYKYGYFTDPFSDNTRADLNHPDFYASFVGGRLVPKIEDFNLEFMPNDPSVAAGEIITLPFTEWPLISQLGATDGAVESTPPADDPYTPLPNTAPANTTFSANVNIYQTAIVEVASKNSMMSMNWNVYEDSEFFMADRAGPVEFYFNCRDNWMAIEIFQGSEAGFTIGSPIYTAQNASILTATDMATKASNLGSHQQLDDFGLQGSPSKRTIEDSGKILWTHNPSVGRYYKIRMYKGKKSGSFPNSNGKFLYRLYYPIMATIRISSTVAIPSSFAFNGFTTHIAPSSFIISSTIDTTTGQVFFSDAQSFTMEMTGLRPNTIHKWYMEDVDQSANCLPPGSALGANLISASDGTLTFTYFYDAGLDEVTTDFEQYNLQASALQGFKFGYVASADYSSVAIAPFYIKTYSNTTRTTTANTVASVAGWVWTGQHNIHEY